MCTLTWAITPGGYELHFNRDERRSRPKAELPSLHQNTKYPVVAPRDPEAGGTWISVNQSGLSLCLLNNYRAEKRYQGNVSRGLLVQNISVAGNLEEALQLMKQVDISAYSPFDLFIFFPESHPFRISWNGELTSQDSQLEPFASSSGFEASAVVKGRRDQHLNWAGKNLLDFHRSHQPERSAYSVCMHRSDARTQSYSNIRVGQETCEFWYADGPPCDAELKGPWSLERKN